MSKRKKRKKEYINESNNCQVNLFKRNLFHIFYKGRQLLSSPLSNSKKKKKKKKEFPSLNFIPPRWISIEYSYARIVTTNIRSCGNILVNSKGTNLYWQILRKFRVVRHRLDVSGEIRFRLTSHGIPFALESLNTLPDFDDPSKRGSSFWIYPKRFVAKTK